MPTPIMQQIYNMLYIGHDLPSKNTQAPSQYSSHPIQIGTKISTHIQPIPRHILSPTLLQKNQQKSVGRSCYLECIDLDNVQQAVVNTIMLI